MQHEIVGCNDGDLGTALSQLKKDGRRILDFWRNKSRSIWFIKLMAVR